MEPSPCILSDTGASLPPVPASLQARAFQLPGEAPYIAQRDEAWSLPGDADVTDAMPSWRSSSALPAAAHYEPAGDQPYPAVRAGSGVCRPGVPEPSAHVDRPSSRPRAEYGHLPFLIRRDGTWLYRGSVVQRKELVCLFASVLTRDAVGAYWLQTPVERGRIEVEDVPFVAVELDWAGCGSAQVLSFRTNVDQCVTAGPRHPLRVHHDSLTEEPTPYLLVRPGQGAAPIEARINRATYYELVALAVPEVVGGHRQLGVWSCQHFFPLGDVPPDED